MENNLINDRVIDRVLERKFIALQTTVIVLGILVHSIVLMYVGYNLQNRLEATPADVLQKVEEVRTDQARQFGDVVSLLRGQEEEDRLAIIIKRLDRIEARLDR